MTFYLYSRVQRIGGFGGCGYRDIMIHEMTESEIASLKVGRVLFPLMAAMLGFLAGAVYMVFAIHS